VLVTAPDRLARNYVHQMILDLHRFSGERFGSYPASLSN